MTRVASLVRRTPGETPADLRRRLLDSSTPATTIDLADTWPRPGDPAAVVWGQTPVSDEAWLVDTRPQWDGLTRDDPTNPVPGIKQVSFLTRVAALDHDAFVHAWERHATLARRHHPMLWRYTQNMVVEPLTPTTPELDGIAELTMRLRQDFVDRMYDSPEGQRIIAADVRGFIDLSRGWRLLARQYGDVEAVG